MTDMKVTLRCDCGFVLTREWNIAIEAAFCPDCGAVVKATIAQVAAHAEPLWKSEVLKQAEEILRRG